jgi:hypothetical protein
LLGGDLSGGLVVRWTSRVARRQKCLLGVARFAPDRGVTPWEHEAIMARYLV